MIERRQWFVGQQMATNWVLAPRLKGKVLVLKQQSSPFPAALFIARVLLVSHNFFYRSNERQTEQRLIEFLESPLRSGHLGGIDYPVFWVLDVLLLRIHTFLYDTTRASAPVHIGYLFTNSCNRPKTINNTS